MPEVIQGTDDPVMLVKGKKGFQQILFIPETVVVEYPFVQVILGGENVVNVYQNPGIQNGQDLQVLKQHVSLRPDDVRGINEEDVVALQGFEQRLIYLLFSNCLSASSLRTDCIGYAMQPVSSAQTTR